MNKAFRLAYVFWLLVFGLGGLIATAQPLNRVIQWEKPNQTTVEKETFTSLYFKDVQYDEKRVPVYHEYIPITARNTYSVSVRDAIYESFKEQSLVPASANIGNEAVVKTSTVYLRKKPYLSVTIVPFRKSGSGIERLTSFTIELQNTGVEAARRAPTRNYASTSVLATGNWYKFGVVQSGVYKLSYQSLKKAGIDPDKIDPRSIRIYNNGAGMLPMPNASPRYDDLQENAIYVSGEADGKFNDGDYVLFFGRRQTQWKYDATTKHYTHTINDYSDTTYYFFTADLGAGKRISTRASSTLTPTQTVTSFDDYEYHEADLILPLISGRQWYGESFDNSRPSQTFSFNMPGLVTSEPVYATANAISKTYSNNGNYQLSLNGNTIGSTSIGRTSSCVTCDYALVGNMSGTGLSNSNQLNVGIQYSSTEASALGYLNYIEINVRRALDFSGVLSQQILFRDSRTYGAGNIARYTFSNAPSGTRIWDVSDPLNTIEQQTEPNSSTTSPTFVAAADTIYEYAAFTDNSALSPVFIGQVANQNLHGMKQAELLIVTHPLFLSKAKELAEFHKNIDGYESNIATTQQVFNEFSGGSQDVSAIRDFAKMFYDRAATDTTHMPKFLLLFGDCSFDAKYRVPNNTNFVITYESAASLNLTSSYASDDYFGFLDDTEGRWDISDKPLMDISVGRLTVKSIPEAEAVVKKIIAYGSPEDPTVTAAKCANQTAAGGVMGDWRNIVTFVADDQDSNIHFDQAQEFANKVQRNYPVYNIEKIYLDAYKQESTPGGQRFPEAHDALVKRVQRGSLLVTYIGHGGEVGWCHERVLENADINGWTNFDKLPAFMTATCEFSRPDDPNRTSAGEYVLLNPNGGGIALYTTTRLAFSSSNAALARGFFDVFFAPMSTGKMPTCGEIFQMTKNKYSDPWTRNFMLLGDPALRFAYPQMKVSTTTINTHPANTTSDTLKALSKVTITGQVTDKSGVKLPFNGIVYPTVYDKWVTYHTLGNDSDWTGDGGSDYPAPFDMQKNILYKGKTKVTNGDFSFTFVVPKDISFKYGFGKLSYYAENGTMDANGLDTSFIIGGVNENAPADNAGPEVKLFMNDESFVFGGTTDQSPFLFGKLKDENGINTAGNGIGHDIIAVLDDSKSAQINLNDYYEADLDTFVSGTIRYQFNDLSEGRHSLSLKAWDVYNNSAEARTEFIVASDAKLALDHVLNYPNPFTTHTTFMFEVNRCCTYLDAQVQIFTISGKLVKTIDATIFSEGYRSQDIHWDGKDDYGDKIGRGVYVYKLKVRAPDKTAAEKFEKLVILK